ncbi:hypothetical protein JCM10450v2_006134 [Rhodotorula kratochvilovae]
MAAAPAPPPPLDAADPAPAPPAQLEPMPPTAVPVSPALSDATTLNSDAAQPTAPPKHFSLDLLRRPLSRSSHPGHNDDEQPVGHQARVLYALITGSIPPAPPPPKKRVPSLPSLSRVVPGRRRTGALSPRAMASVLSLATVAEPELSMDKARGTRAREGQEERCRPVPHVKPKTLKKLKADLVNADKARAIVADLHRMEVPLDEDSSAPPTPLGKEPDAPPKRKVSRGYALPPLEDPTALSPAQPASSAAAEGDPKLPFATFGAGLPPMSPGALGGLAAARTGAFELLADMTGALIEKSGAHDGVYALPQDRVSVFVYWWGFEILLPPPAIRTLSSVASVQSSFFTFLQAFVLAGGAPELAPFVKYISSYIDMEWQAIKAQNKGNGVILAATWLLPVALVPRAWDVPIRCPAPLSVVKSA